ncbi:MAG: Holliday junction resolvase RuvX [Alphaproteobacteria bacterium]|nr:Holliday junction resolvase RuvX [Alphaproteobacteria bacterium]
MPQPETNPDTGIAGLKRLRAELAPGKCVLGLDSGKQRWGLAISDDALRVALPLAQYSRGKYAKDLKYLAQVIAERNVGGIIIGLPLHMDGVESPRAQAARQLARDIKKRMPEVVVALWDERMSSVAMSRAMIEEGDLSRKKRSKAIDKLAASFILQGALEALNSNS